MLTGSDLSSLQPPASDTSSDSGCPEDRVSHLVGIEKIPENVICSDEKKCILK